MNKGKVTYLDKTLGKIIEEVYNENKDRLNSSAEVREIYEDYFRFVNEIMQSSYYPRVKIPKFGEFIPYHTKIEKLCNGVVKKHKENVDDSYIEKLGSTIERLYNEITRKKRNTNDSRRND